MVPRSFGLVVPCHPVLSPLPIGHSEQNLHRQEKEKEDGEAQHSQGASGERAARAEASEEVTGMLDRTAGIPIENPAAMVPFFEQLRRAASGESSGPLSILHYGDSHTAADDWTG